jgi:hypothetical protein
MALELEKSGSHEEKVERPCQPQISHRRVPAAPGIPCRQTPSIPPQSETHFENKNGRREETGKSAENKAGKTMQHRPTLTSVEEQIMTP